MKRWLPPAAIGFVAWFVYANAQACWPEARVMQMLGAAPRIELDAAQRVAFMRDFNALPPLTDHPAPDRILIADLGGGRMALLRSAPFAGALCGGAHDDPQMVALLRRFLGRDV